jgi:hypothetical protein
MADLQALANFSHLIDQYKRAKAGGNDKLQVLDKDTCTLSVKVYDRQTGEASWQFLGNLPLAAVDEVKQQKLDEIAEIDALKAAMISEVEKIK